LPSIDDSNDPSYVVPPIEQKWTPAKDSSAGSAKAVAAEKVKDSEMNDEVDAKPEGPEDSPKTKKELFPESKAKPQAEKETTADTASVSEQPTDISSIDPKQEKEVKSEDNNDNETEKEVKSEDNNDNETEKEVKSEDNNDNETEEKEGTAYKSFGAGEVAEHEKNADGGKETTKCSLHCAIL